MQATSRRSLVQRGFTRRLVGLNCCRMFESYDSFMPSLTLPTLAHEFSLRKPEIGGLSALRFCGVLGMGGTWTAGAARASECWGPKLRGKGWALMQMGLPIGTMLAIAAAPLVILFVSGTKGRALRQK